MFIYQINKYVSKLIKLIFMPFVNKYVFAFHYYSEFSLSLFTRKQKEIAVCNCLFINHSLCIGKV